MVDRLAELELPVTPYNGGEAPIDKHRFVNARAEDYWMMRERLDPSRRTRPSGVSRPTPRESGRVPRGAAGGKDPFLYPLVAQRRAL